jgi:hypothetical protein
MGESTEIARALAASLIARAPPHPIERCCIPITVYLVRIQVTHFFDTHRRAIRAESERPGDCKNNHFLCAYDAPVHLQ